MKCSSCKGTGKSQTAASKLLFGVCLACNGSGKKLLTMTQANALVNFANVHGRTWKQSLRHAWETGVYPAIVKDTASLQQIRNAFGPSWLVRLRLADLYPLHTASPSAPPSLAPKPATPPTAPKG